MVSYIDGSGLHISIDQKGNTGLEERPQETILGCSLHGISVVRLSTLGTPSELLCDL